MGGLADRNRLLCKVLGTPGFSSPPAGCWWALEEGLCCVLRGHSTAGGLGEAAWWTGACCGKSLGPEASAAQLQDFSGRWRKGCAPECC